MSDNRLRTARRLALLSEAVVAFETLANLEDHQGLLAAATVVGVDLRRSVSAEESIDPGFRDLFDRERVSLRRWTEIKP